jgi:hypothetical protein
VTFRYFVVESVVSPGRPSGVFAVNRDKEANRLDMVLFNHQTKQWESDPDAVGVYLFGDDCVDRREEVSRSQAERSAELLGITIPPEHELMRISDEAERERAQRR